MRRAFLSSPIFDIIYGMKKIILSMPAVAAAFAATVFLPAYGEEPYAFRSELECVHASGLRKASAKPVADEFVFRDGCVVGDADFADFLKKSMGVKVASDGSAPAVRTGVDKGLRPREYKIAVDSSGVTVAGADERAVCDALWHLEDVMALRGGPFLKHGTETRRPRFAHRITHSGLGLAVFPDAYLSRLAHAGFTDITLFVAGPDTTAGGKHVDINDVIDRAAAHHLGVYLYANSKVFAHPADPGGKEALDEAFGGFAAMYPKAKGMIFVGESCQFPSKDPRVQPVTWRNKNHKDPRPTAGWFPCSDYADWITVVRDCVRARAPHYDIIFWTYNWGWAPEKERIDLIDTLPQDITLMATFEMFQQHVKRNGLKSPIADYSLSLAGPGGYFASEAAAASRRKLTLGAMSNTAGRTWDFGTAPYEPCPWQWKKRWDAMLRENAEHGLSLLVESHHYGWYPSFVTELAKEAFTEGGIPFDEHIRRIAVRDYGEANADAALKAWRIWSDAIADYVPSNLNQYGPFRIGPAYPYTFGHPSVKPDELPVDRSFPQAVNICWYAYPVSPVYKGYDKEGSREAERLELDLLCGMISRFTEGASMFRAMGPRAARMADLGDYLACALKTAVNVKRGGQAFRGKDDAAVRRFAEEEYANAAAALPLVLRNSAFGWEPSMGYVGGVEQIRWKMARMERDYGLGKRIDTRRREYVTPVRVVAESSSASYGSRAKVVNARHLLMGVPFRDTLGKGRPDGCTLVTDGGDKAWMVLDFGRELHGGVRIGVSYSTPRGMKIRLRFGESVGEVLSDLGESGASNDHAIRDTVVDVPTLASFEFGQTGFRFVNIELVTTGKLDIEEVSAVSVMRDMKQIGSFKCPDARINAIWDTCARTVHLCSQEYLWDGIKRDRLVWMGDTHPETKALLAVFGAGATVIPETLDYIARETPPDRWMNTMPTYTLWWLRNVHEWYAFTGDAAWVRERAAYIEATVDHVLANLTGSGEWGRETGGNAFFLDHPSRENPSGERIGAQGLAVMTLHEASRLLRICGDETRARKVEAACTKLMARGKGFDAHGSKQAAAMLALSGLRDAKEMNEKVLLKGGASGVTTFFGYYMLEAMSAGGNDNAALGLVRDYWGGMLDMGATSFWEDFDLAWTNGCARIDVVPAFGQKDVHGANGRFCYVGYRNSLCHGWAAGPAAWLHEHVLGVRQVAPAEPKYEVKPSLGDLAWAEGDVPTAWGTIHVKAVRKADGTAAANVTAPEGVTIVR